MTVTLWTYAMIAHPTPDLRSGLIDGISYAIPYALTGALLIVRRPDLPFGWLLAGTAALVSVASALAAGGYLVAGEGGGLALGHAGLAVEGVTFLPPAVQGVINIRFPSGRPSSRAGRLLEVAIVAGSALGLISGALNGTTWMLRLADGTTRAIANPLTGGTEVGRIASGLTVVVPIVILLGALAGLGVVRRAWTAAGVERAQLRWRAFGVVLSLALFPLAVTETLPHAVSALDGLFFVTTLVIPIVRYRLWAIDTIIRRSAAYALVTFLVAAGFAVIAALGTALAGRRFGFVAAAALGAVAFAPLLGYCQRLVDRVFYGRRNDPYRALTDLGRRLAAVTVPGDVLPAVVTAVAESLRLPYVAIERPGDGSVLAAHGEPGERAERWPLTYRGTTVGDLVAAPRAGETSFGDRDRAVLADLAHQAGPAVHAEALTADLLDSRQRLVSAREEERRRLRRDLHDGLGPLLTAIGLNLDAARARGPHPEATEALLRAAKEASAQAIGDLRVIVHGLRPQALDDLGLVGAVTTHTRRLAETTPLRISVDADDVPELPAAVEVAAFRVTVEAVTNVVRHAAASRCRVRLGLAGPEEFVVSVSDDGGESRPWSPGVGLLAMRERVAELGGTLVAGPTSDGGSVSARFPLLRAVS